MEGPCIKEPLCEGPEGGPWYLRYHVGRLPQVLQLQKLWWNLVPCPRPASEEGAFHPGSWPTRDLGRRQGAGSGPPQGYLSPYPLATPHHGGEKTPPQPVKPKPGHEIWGRCVPVAPLQASGQQSLPGSATIRMRGPGRGAQVSRSAGAEQAGQGFSHSCPKRTLKSCVFFVL